MLTIQPSLAALCMERVETVVASADLPLLGFFYGAGFAPAQRLALIKTLEPAKP